MDCKNFVYLILLFICFNRRRTILRKCDYNRHNKSSQRYRTVILKKNRLQVKQTHAKRNRLDFVRGSWGK